MINRRMDALRTELGWLGVLRAHHLHDVFGWEAGAPGKPGAAAEAAAVLGVERKQVASLFNRIHKRLETLDETVRAILRDDPAINEEHDDVD